MAARRKLLAAAAALAIVALAAEAAHRLVPGLIDGVVRAQVEQQVAWRRDSPPPVQRRWEGDTHPGDPPMRADFYFFNVTNLAEVRAGGRPRLHEVGPYSYVKHTVRASPSWSAGDAEVTFSERFYYVPVPGGRPADEPITTINLPLAGALEKVGTLSSPLARRLLAALAAAVDGWRDARVAGVFTTRTAGELLWGYDDPLLARLSRLLPGVPARLALVVNQTAGEPPFWRDVASTGLVAEQTPRADGSVSVSTRLDPARVWQYKTWHNVSAVTAWAPPHVEPVAGSDASQFPPGLAPGASAAVWIGDAYRAATLEAAPADNCPGGAEQAARGCDGRALRHALGPVPVLRFRPAPSLWAPDPRYYQAIQGLLNVTAPTAVGAAGSSAGAGGGAGAPVFLSAPHFCGADPALAAGVDGLACDPARHSIYVDVEPATGIALRAQQALMVSSWYGRRWRAVDPRLGDGAFLPLMWVHLASEATPAQLRLFAPLLAARRAADGVRRWARPAGAGAAAAAAACLAAAAVLGGRGGARGGALVNSGGAAAAPPPPPASPPPSDRRRAERRSVRWEEGGDASGAAASAAEPLLGSDAGDDEALEP